MEEVYARKQFHLQGRFTQDLIDQTVTVATPRGPLSFVTIGKGAAGRALSLLERQPATISWIDSFQPNSIFWDIGANVGVYTLYAALRGDIKVVAFEPAAVNYFILCANCEANKLEDRVECLLVGLGSERAVARLEVSQFAAAHAARTLRQHDLRELHIEMIEESAAGQRIANALAGTGFVMASRHTHGGSTDVTFGRRGAWRRPPASAGSQRGTGSDGAIGSHNEKLEPRARPFPGILRARCSRNSESLQLKGASSTSRLAS